MFFLLCYSLLTLSRVIVALGAPNQTHINFRDSKLTRILQPSLSGNARMAVICCATPSELYLEETRSTLQFASRAKLVKTNAQVNEVLDERSMIRRLQKQLAEAKRNQTGPGQEQVRDLEAQVATAGTQAVKAKEKLDRLKASILNTGYIFDQDAFYDVDPFSKGIFEASKKRRKSDGPLLIGHPSPSKELKSIIDSPKTAPRKKRSKVLQHPTLDTKQELKLVQEALATRNNFVHDLNLTLNKYSDQIKEKNSDAERMLADNFVLNEEKQQAHAEMNSLQEMVASLKQTLDSSIKENELVLVEKDSVVMASFEKLQQTLGEQDDLRKQVAEGEVVREENETLTTRLAEIELERATLQERISSLEDNSQKELDDFAVYTEDLQSKITKATEDNTEVRKEKEEIALALQDVNNRLTDTSDKLQQQLDMAEESESQLLGKEKEFKVLELRIVEATERNTEVCKEKEEIELALQDANDRLADTSNKLQQQLATTEENQSQLLGKEEQFEILELRIVEATEKNTEVCKEKEEITLALQDANTRLVDTSNQLESKQSQILENEEEISNLTERQTVLESENNEFQGEISRMTKVKMSMDAMLLFLQEQVTTVKVAKKSTEKANGTLEEKLSEVEKELNNLRENNAAVVLDKESSMQSLESRLAETEAQLECETALKEALEQKISEVQQTVEDCVASEETLMNSFNALSVEKTQLESQLHQCKEDIEDMDRQLQMIKDEQDVVVAEKNSMEAVLGSYQASSIDMERQLNEAEEQISRVQSEYESMSIKKDQSVAELENIRESLNMTTTELSSLKIELEEATQNIQSMVDKNSTKDSSLEKLQAEKEQSILELQDQVNVCREEIQELQDNLSEIEDIDAAKDSSIEQLQAEKQQSLQEIVERSEEIELLKGSLLDTKTKLEEREAIFYQLSAEKADLQAILNNLESGIVSKDSVLSQLQADKEDLTRQLESHVTELVAVSSDNTSKDSRIEQLEKEAGDLKSRSEGLSADVEIHNNEIESLLLNLMRLTSEKEELDSYHVELMNSCESLAGENETIYDRLSVMKMQNVATEEELATINVEHMLMTERNVALELLNEKSEQVLAEIRVENENASAEYEEEIVALTEQIDSVFNEATYFQAQSHELQNAVDNLQSELEDKQSRVVELQNEVEDMANRHEAILRDRKAEHDEATSEATSFQERNQELQNAVDNLQSELEDKQSRVLELQNEVESMTSSREILTQSLRDREAERDEATRELERLYDENRELNSTVTNTLPKVKEEKLLEEMSELKAQNLELKHLLASVNESEERLRNAVADSENSCRTKASKLEDAQYRLSQIEHELSQSQTYSQTYDAELSQVEESKADLAECFETVRKEKEHIEQLLEEEIDARNKLQIQMGEEQRALIQEGENMMAELRSKVEDYEEKLNRSESEAYTARQNIEEINDEKKTLEEKYLEACAQVNSSGLSTEHQEEQIVVLESELNDAKSESYALKESVIDMKEKMRRSTRDGEKAIRESSIATSEVSTLRRKLSSLENLNESNQVENSKLRKKLKELREYENMVGKLQGELEDKENEIVTVQKEISVLKLEKEKVSTLTHDLEPNANAEENASLKSDMKQMNELINDQKKRIKKLEVTKLTKTKIEALKKIQVCL